jgi:MFS transporter, Spinster family, sphingosine-1-phosphate transporter
MRYSALVGCEAGTENGHVYPRLTSCVTCRQRVYTLTILGNTLHTAVLGMFAYWGPKGATLIFQMKPGRADLVFGPVTVATGILGTLAGGWVLDKLGGNAHAAGRVCVTAITVGFALLQLAFIFTTAFSAFVSVFAVGQFTLFMLQVRSIDQSILNF